MSAETRDAAIRDAKRHVYEVTRNDWTFEPSSPPSRDIATHTPTDPEQEWQEWRLREHDSSGSELQPQPSPTDVDGDSSGSSRALGTRESRRKRRRQVEEEEMRWNVGLRTWVERRDAWTGARRRRRGVCDCGPAEQSSEKLAARTEASLAIAEREGGPGDGEGPRSLNDAVGDSAESVPTSTTSTSEVCDPLIPVAPSFIPQSNPVRASITPALYPSIYSKVVVQGLTPTVPINLADVTKAMVQGWKSDGQWPPKPTSIVLPDDSIARKSSSAAAGDKQASPESKKRSSVASAVKKVLHFSGFHPRPFHRRGSSHGGHSELHDGHKDVGPAPSPPGTGHSK